MRKALAVAAIFLLTGCALQTPVTDPQMMSACGPRPTDDQAHTAVQTYVNGFGFLDPAAVRVKNIAVVQPLRWYRGLLTGNDYAFGWQIDFELNAKNGFGAYTGFRRTTIILFPDHSIGFRPVLD